MNDQTKTDVKRWREERDRLIVESVTAGKSLSSLQPREAISGAISRQDVIERRIAELDRCIVDHEVPDA